MINVWKLYKEAKKIESISFWELLGTLGYKIICNENKTRCRIFLCIAPNGTVVKFKLFKTKLIEEYPDVS